MSNTVLLGILGCGGLSAIVYFISKYFSTDLSISNKLLNSFAQDKLTEIENEQTKLKVTINNNKKLSIEKEKKIKDILNKSSKDIDDILKEKDIFNIQQTIDNN
jgi:CRISPR/Cas system-associated endonuclease Cas3-HD